MDLIYTGVGSRECPPEVGHLMTKIATFLYEEGYILRSGGAPGADTYFERGVTNDDGKEIYLARKGEFGNPSRLYGVCEEALLMAESIHPNWNAPGMTRNQGHGRKLHARNCYQVLGQTLSIPSKFLLCWTENGEAKGGTRTAIKLAELNEIPVFNFGAVKSKKYMEAFELFYMRVCEWDG